MTSAGNTSRVIAQNALSGLKNTFRMKIDGVAAEPVHVIVNVVKSLKKAMMKTTRLLYLKTYVIIMIMMSLNA